MKENTFLSAVCSKKIPIPSNTFSSLVHLQCLTHPPQTDVVTLTAYEKLHHNFPHSKQLQIQLIAKISWLYLKT